MTEYNTEILSTDTPDQTKIALETACRALTDGEVVGIPTETVYGLGANGTDPDAIRKIFRAKGRPQDNPLILHICDMDMLYEIADAVPLIGLELGKKFWPGPLTMIFKRKESVPSEVSAGLDTVAVRMPLHGIARELIRMCGFPIAAPSANLSGTPSTTTAHHVYEDLQGKIPYIIDGGECAIGLESTVVDLSKDTPIILRPGKITKEDIESVTETEVMMDPGITKFTEYDGSVSSPGMKYKHYSPNADVKIFCGSSDEFVNYVNSKEDVFALCFEEDAKYLHKPYLCYGKSDDFDSQGRELFAALRKFDQMNAKTVIAHAPEKKGMGLSVYNRLIKSAGFEVVSGK